MVKKRIACNHAFDSLFVFRLRVGSITVSLFRNASGEKPYKCHWPDCGKSFGQLTNLKSHVARHTPNKSRSRKGASSQKKSEEPKNEVRDNIKNIERFFLRSFSCLFGRY